VNLCALSASQRQSDLLLNIDIEIKSDALNLVLLEGSKSNCLSLLTESGLEVNLSVRRTAWERDIADVEDSVVVILKSRLGLVWLAFLDNTTPEHSYLLLFNNKATRTPA
jgi:hypothetical protein